MTLVRPIDGNALIEKIDKIDWYHVNEDGKLVSGAKNVLEAYFPAFDIYDAVEYMSTIDVAPVVHAKWVGNNGTFCSNCGKSDANAFNHHIPYCWNCGAKMDGGINGH